MSDPRSAAKRGQTVPYDINGAPTGAAGIASDISLTPVGGIAATDVQAAVQELDSEKAGVVHTHTASQVTDLTEVVQDLIAATLVNGGSIGLVYDDAAGTLTLTLQSHVHAVADVTGLQTALDGKQTLDATLTGLAGLDSTAGLVEQTGADAFTKRAIGAAAATSVLTRADGDGRYALTVHTHVIADVTGLQAALDGKQPLDSELTALAGLTSAADRLPYFTGAGAASLATFTAFGRSLVGDADAAAARATLSLGTAATQNTGTSGTVIPLLDGANTWSGQQIFQRSGDIARFTNGTRSLYFAADSSGVSLFSGAGQTGSGLYVNEGSGYVAIWVGNAERLRVTTSGIDVTGEVRGDSLRIDASATAAAVAQTHHVPISINGVAYKLLLAA